MCDSLRTSSNRPLKRISQCHRTAGGSFGPDSDHDGSVGLLNPRPHSLRLQALKRPTQATMVYRNFVCNLFTFTGPRIWINSALNIPRNIVSLQNSCSSFTANVY